MVRRASPPNRTVPVILDRAARAFLARHRVAHFATADAGGQPHVVPLCYALAGPHVYFVVDEKPKAPGGRALKRMRNLAENPAVALVVDDYAEDWDALAFLLVRGRAAVVTDGRERARALRALRARYPQYRTMRLEGPEHPVVRITPERVHLWSAVRRRASGARSPRRAGRSRRTTSPRRQRRRRPR
jgi:PPOX class probable F420-dependent enzyme